MNDTAKGLLLVGVLGLAYVSKPSEAAFKSRIDSAFNAARTNEFNSGNFMNWAGLVVADNTRSGIYHDNTLYASYDVSVAGRQIHCWGAFGTVIDCS